MTQFQKVKHKKAIEVLYLRVVYGGSGWRCRWGVGEHFRKQPYFRWSCPLSSRHSGSCTLTF